MCTKTFVLVLLFILKIIIFIIPGAIFIFKKTGFIDKFIKYFYYFEFMLLIFLIGLSIFSGDCIKNSSINGIKLNYKLFDNSNYIDEDKTAIDYKNINPSKVYKTNYSNDISYYNINLYPVRNIKVICNKKSYFQNYGNDIAAVTSALSVVSGINENLYGILETMEKNNLLSCENGINMFDVFSTASSMYNLNFRAISIDEIVDNLNLGKVILAKTKVNDAGDNLSCGEKLIVIYYHNGKKEFNILNPSDKKSDYFCPNNTTAYGTIVKGNQNSLTYDLDSLSNYLSDYYVLEVK